MILYHGSNVSIDAIDLSKSRPGKDFGTGFYLSADENQAIEMAESKVAFLGGEPVVTSFEFDESILSSNVLKIKMFDKPIREYDIIYGPIANDRVGAQIRNYKNGNINLDELMNRIKYLKGITFQYYFGTEAAINTLRKL